MSILYVVLSLVALQRLVELWYASRNTRRLRARGAIEYGGNQYPFFVALHLAWLIAIGVLVPRNTQPNWTLLWVYVALQPLRIWAVASLGPYWTTRIISVPGEPLVRRGAYRFFRHPNYVVVCAEIAVLPLAFHATEIAIVFSFLNAALLSWRIRVEERALLVRRRNAARS